MASWSPLPHPTRASNPDAIAPESITRSRSKLSITRVIPQRNLGFKSGVGTPCSCGLGEDDENNPSAASLMATKNFMAPTISAASKFVNVSPEKGVLMDRNEAAPSSLTSSCHCLEFSTMEGIESRPELGCGPWEPPNASKSLSVSSAAARMEEVGQKPEVSFGFHGSSGKTKSRKGDREFKNHQSALLPPSFPSPGTAASGSGPGLRPYDPTTNYLSPRPRFLRYKPNTRIEQYLNKKGEIFGMRDGKGLEDCFSFRRHDVAEELQSPSPFMKRGFREHSCTCEAAVIEGRVNAHVYGPGSREKPTSNYAKSHFLAKSKTVLRLSVLVIACLSFTLTDSPILSSSSLLRDRPFRRLYSPASKLSQYLYLRDYLTELVVFAKENIKGLGNAVMHCLSSSMAYSPALVSPSNEELGSLHLVDSTTSSVNLGVDFSYNGAKPDKEENNPNDNETRREENSLDYEIERKIEKVDVSDDVREDDFPTEHKAGKEINMAVSEDLEKFSGSREHEINQKLKERGEGHGEINYSEKAENTADIVKEEHSNDSCVHLNEPVAANKQGNSFNIRPAFQTQAAISSDSISESDEDNLLYDDLQSFTRSNDGPDIKLPMRTVLCMFTVMLSLSATLISYCLKQKQSPTSTYEGLIPNKLSSTSASDSIESSPHFGASATDSYLHSSSFSGQKKTKRVKNEKISSHEQRRRRRGSAFSSSISYGSFTTYEILPVKKGCGDEEAVTPVRRSSRIRNQLAST